MEAIHEKNYKNIIKSIEDGVDRDGLKNTSKRESEALKFCIE